MRLQAVWYLRCGNWNGISPTTAPPPAPAPVALSRLRSSATGRVGGSIARAAASAPGIVVSAAGRGDGRRRQRRRPTPRCSACPTRRSRRPRPRSPPPRAPLRSIGHTSGADRPRRPGAGRRSGRRDLLAASAADHARCRHRLHRCPCAIAGSTPAAAGARRPRWPGASAWSRSSSPRRTAPPTTPPPAIASNFLVALEESAAELLEAAGVEDAPRRCSPRSSCGRRPTGPSAGPRR